MLIVTSLKFYKVMETFDKVYCFHHHLFGDVLIGDLDREGVFSRLYKKGSLRQRSKKKLKSVKTNSTRFLQLLKIPFLL